MGSKKINFLFISVLVLGVSCLSDSGNPRSVSQAQYNSTMEEVQQFIIDLNGIIRNRNYSAWRAALSQEYFREISSAEYLRQISEQQILKNQGIVLRTAEDYFNNVVVPARANNRVNERVDDIEFMSGNKVKAYTINSNGQRLLLYNLEKIGNTWKITN